MGICILGNGDCFVPTEYIDIRDFTYSQSQSLGVQLKCSGNCMYLVQVYIDVDINVSTNPNSKLILSGEGKTSDSQWNVSLDFFTDEYTNKTYTKDIILAKGSLFSNNYNNKYPVALTTTSSWGLRINIGNGEPPIQINRFIIKAIPYKGNYNNKADIKVYLPLKTDLPTQILTIGTDTYNVSRKAKVSQNSEPVVLAQDYNNKVSGTEVKSPFLPIILIILLLAIVAGLAFFFIKTKKPAASMTTFGKKLYKISKGY